MNCPTCGATLTDGTTTCPTCGASISQPADFNQMQYQQPETNFNQAQHQQPQANFNQTQHQQPQANFNQAQYQQPQANFNQAQYQQPQANYDQVQYQQPQANYNQMPYANSSAYAPVGAKFTRKFNAGHFAVMGGSLLCLISVFLPFLTVSLFGFSESMSLFKDGDDGIIFLVTAIVIIALSMLRVNTLNIILTLIQGIFAIYETVSAKSELSDYDFGSMVQYGAGFYLLLIGGIVAFVGAIIGLVLHINAKKAFNQA